MLVSVQHDHQSGPPPVGDAEPSDPTFGEVWSKSSVPIQLRQGDAVAGLGVASQAGLLSFKRFTIQGLTEAARKLLKTRAKQWLIKLFKMIGLRLTQRGLLRVIPFGVGVVLGYSSNKKLTRYIGRRARDYFIEAT